MPITQQTIAIIGANGSVGSDLAKGVADGNYRLLLFGKDSKSLKLLRNAIHQEQPNAEVHILDCAHECSWEADIIVLDIPAEDEKYMAEKIHDVATQKTVVRVADSSDSEIQEWLPFSKVVQVFKHESKSRVILSGDDEDSLENTSELFKTAGFEVSITLHPVKAIDS